MDDTNGSIGSNQRLCKSFPQNALTFNCSAFFICSLSSSMATWHELADLLFPEVQSTISDLLTQYPARSEQVCLRFSPSPTGYLHLGSLYTTLIGSTYARQHKGTFFLRIEDTDQKREIQGAASLLIQSLKIF
jgi:glutamyl-tRNA synthetase